MSTIHGMERSDGTFRTSDLSFAAYLYTTRQLEFLKCEQHLETSRIDFVFSDPGLEGTALQLSFESGATCGAANYFDSIRRLRKVMTQTQQYQNRVREFDYGKRSNQPH